MRRQRRLQISRVTNVGNVLEQSGVAFRLAPPDSGLLVNWKQSAEIVCGCHLCVAMADWSRELTYFVYVRSRESPGWNPATAPIGRPHSLWTVVLGTVLSTLHMQCLDRLSPLHE